MIYVKKYIENLNVVYIIIQHYVKLFYRIDGAEWTLRKLYDSMIAMVY